MIFKMYPHNIRTVTYDCLIIAFNMKIQSIVLLLFRNPNCDSGKYDLSSAHSVNLALMIEIKIFPMLHNNVMPR